jgi:membrane protease YdiL (CAAX protease family)
MLKNYKGYLRCLFFYLLIELILFLFGGGISFYLSEKGISNTEFPVLSSIGYLISSLIIIIITFFFFNQEFHQLKTWMQLNIRVIKSILALFLTSVILFILIIIFSISFKFITGSFTDLFNNTSMEVLSKLFFSSLIVGFSEEVVFRGILTSYFIKNTNLIFAIIVISILFSFGHVNYTSNISFLSAFIFAVLMTIIVLWSKSIYPSVFFHTGWNFSYFLLQKGFNYGSTISNENQVRFEMIQLVGLVLVFILVSSFLIGRKNLKGNMTVLNLRKLNLVQDLWKNSKKVM